MAWRAKRFNVPVKKDKQRKTGGNATHDGNKVDRYNGSGHHFTPEERAKRRLERLMKVGILTANSCAIDFTEKRSGTGG